ncbi:MAG TPA: hypothetical protein VG145_10920 [Xanthobacteraceae bacterium]|jgi:hypothetical protein|nr:hypothetical protein [Xanthobacteraceae bacterium]
MLTPDYLCHHVEALLRLSRNVKDPAAAAKLQEMADELRIVISVTDIVGLAADLKGIDIPPAPDRLSSRAAEVVPFRRQDRLSARNRWR